MSESASRTGNGVIPIHELVYHQRLSWISWFCSIYQLVANGGCLQSTFQK